jgi:PIN domain nuclease of toxin-antitoxin system
MVFRDEVAELPPDPQVALLRVISLQSFLQEVEFRFVVLPITGRACVRAMELPATYPKDPADRIIGATALVEGLPLLTADPEILQSKVIRTIW